MMHRNYSWSERAYKTLAAIVAVAGIATATQGCGTRHIYRNPGKHYVIKSENRVAAEKAEEAQEQHSQQIVASSPASDLEGKVNKSDVRKDPYRPEIDEVYARTKTAEEWYNQGVGVEFSDDDSYIEAIRCLHYARFLNPLEGRISKEIGTAYRFFAMDKPQDEKEELLQVAVRFYEEAIVRDEEQVKQRGKATPMDISDLHHANGGLGLSYLALGNKEKGIAYLRRAQEYEHDERFSYIIAQVH